MNSYELNSGLHLPPIGFGVFQSSPEDTLGAVRAALDAGYRHIDTAAIYGNEREVGEGIRRSGVAREDVVVETKVWVSDYGFEATLHAFEKSTAKLGFETIDILILHQPAPDRFDATVESYKALEKLYADGRVRTIGVSNFRAPQLADLLARTEVVPALNQIELHPYFQNREAQRLGGEHGILTQAWSPIGGITFYPGDWASTKRVSVMDDETVQEIARNHGRSAAQVMLRWHVQEGRSAIPKSTNAARIAENIDVFDFTLSDDEIARLDGLDTGVQVGPDPSGMFDIAIPEA